MRHTFVVQITADIGDVDPQELMDSVEEIVSDALQAEVDAGRYPELARAEADVECVDAWEAPAQGVGS
jgi:hypothetical protein